jgi:DNA polymerase III epsilon subunit-like protein
MTAVKRELRPNRRRRRARAAKGFNRAIQAAYVKAIWKGNPEMKAFVFDTETTGLINNRRLPLDKQPHITEFFGVLVDLKTGKMTKKVSTLVKPPVHIPPEVTKITGINDATVAEAPPFADVSEMIFSALEAAPVVIAHNLSYDVDMIELEAERLKVKVKWPKKICTVEQTIHIKSFRLKLSLLHEHLFGVPFDGAHRAEADVMALVKCCIELHKRGMI